MKKINKKFICFCIVISVILLFITCYRAFTTGITYDEAYTYMNYVYHNPFAVFRHLFIKSTLANNHLINSFGISCLQYFFDNKYSEVLIRIPNIISYIPYFVFCYLLTKDTKYKYASFSLLTLNYGINEFMGLGRGYGMSCTLVLIGLYFYKLYLNKDKNIMLTLAYIFLMIACYANTSALIVFAAVILISIIKLFKDKKIFKYIFKQWFLLIPIIIFTLLVANYHLMVSSVGHPLYGGKSNFFEDVIVSVFNTYGFNDFLINIIAILFIIAIVVVIIKKFKKLKINYIFYTFIAYFLVLIILTKGTGNMWLTGRALIPSMPLFGLFIVELLESLKIKKEIIINLIVIIPLGLLFAFNVNLKETRDWKNNYVVKDIAYEALRTHDNSEAILHQNNHDTIIPAYFYEKKILLENNYDIFAK